MDKYEYNVRSEQILKLFAENEYKTAAKIADTIDWRRVRSVNMLTTVGEVYERNERYADAKELFLMAYEKAPIGRRLAYRLTEVCIHMGDFEEAQNYYNDFINLSPRDNRKYELIYYLRKKQGAPAEVLVAILEEYKKHDMDEHWAYELAFNYHEAGMIESCIEQCNEIFLWFREGEYVVKALGLKSMYTPLTESQQAVMDEAVAEMMAAQAEAAALEAQRIAEIEAQRAAEIQAQRVAEIEALKAAEARRVAEEEAKRLAEIEARRRAEVEARRAEEEKRLAELEEQRAAEVQRVAAEEAEAISLDEAEALRGIWSDTESVDDGLWEKTETQNVEELYGEQMELYPVSEFRRGKGDTIDIRREQGIIRRNFVDEEEEEKATVSDDQIEGQMTLEEILSTFEKNDGWEVIDKDSTKKEVAYQDEEEVSIAETDEQEQIEEPEPEELPDIESAEADTEELFVDEVTKIYEEEFATVEDKTVKTPIYEEEPGLTYEQKLTFKRFLFMKGMEEQLALLFRDVARTAINTTSAADNLIVAGEYKSGKTTLAVDIIKEINRIHNRNGRKIAKISGERLNYKGLRETFAHLQDADLLVEHVGRMSKATLQGLLRFMSGETGGMLVVFEDTRDGMEYIFSQVPEAQNFFSYYVELREVEISEWVELARRYAKERNFRIDDMAKLALSVKIAELSHDVPIVEFRDVKEIVDDAIRKYNKKHIFKRSKKGDDDVYFVLKEADFK